MIVHIHDNLSIADVHERFSKCFQCLKIEFYNKHHLHKDAPPENFIYNKDKNLGAIRHIHNDDTMALKSWYTVARLSEEFSEKFDLHVLVYKKEKGSWIRVLQDDIQTLQQLNDAACVQHNNISKVVWPDENEGYG